MTQIPSAKTLPSKDLTPGEGRSAQGELLRALASVVLEPPPLCHAALEALGLAALTGAEHTAAFVLGAAPYAAIYLGGEGKLGGEGLDRVAGYWRAIGLVAPPEADHLGLLLLLYAELLDAEAETLSEATLHRLVHVRETLLNEHLWSWVPGYLTAVGRLGGPGLSDWSRMTLSALHREARTIEQAPLALALRSAPEPISVETERDELLDALVTPVRSGIILAHAELGEAAATAALGLRAGEKRYLLAAMIDQDPATTLSFLAEHATSWSRVHEMQPAIGGTDPKQWWAERAGETAKVLARLHTRSQR